MKCNNCGYENKDAFFCAKCGKKLTTDVSETINEKKNKNLVKTLIIMGIAILLIGLFILIKLIFFNPKTNNSYNIYNENNPIIVEKDGLYGYINKDGKVLIRPTYKEASQFIGNHTLVSIRDYDSQTGSKYQIIDKKGKVKYESDTYSNIDYDKENDIWVIDGTLYDGNMNKITEGIYVQYEGYGYSYYESNNESGIIDSKGKIVFKWNDENINLDISDSDTKDHYAEVTNLEDKDLIISLETGKILFENPDTSKYNIMASDDNIFELYDRRTYDEVDYLWFKDNKLAFRLNGPAYSVELKTQNLLEIDYGTYYEDYGKTQRKYYYDYKNDKLLENYIEEETGFSIGDYVQFSCSSKEGLMKNDKIVLPCEYDNMKYLNNNVYEYLHTKNKDLIILEQNDNICLYNINNKKCVYKFKTTNINDIDVYDSTFITYTDNNDNNVVYNILSNKEMIFDEYSDIEVYSNNITIEKDNVISYYNVSLNKICEV